jgi:hypothetical protein
MSQKDWRTHERCAWRSFDVLVVQTTVGIYDLLLVAETSNMIISFPHVKLYLRLHYF